MARIFLTSGQTGGTYGAFDPDVVTGTNDHESVYVAANGKVSFTADFNRGGDTIYIAGAAGLYNATLSASGSQLTLTSVATTGPTAGAQIVIPVGTVGANVVFAGGDSRELYFDTGLNKVCLGEQTLAAGGTVVVDAGDAPVDPDGDTFRLEATADEITGTSGDDLFRARISQNQNGEQTNELGTGDYIDGGAGDDELFATVQDASALNGDPESEIAPITVGVETIRITAQQAGSSDDEDAIEISAEEMYGVEQIISYRSDADLTFYNVNTLTDEPTPGGNVDEGARSTDNIEICMEYTAGDNGLFSASDMCVLFDNDFLIPPGADAVNRIRLQLMDIDNQILTDRPLLTNPFDILILTFDTGGTAGDGNDKQIFLSLDPAAYRNGLTGAAAYQALVDDINAKLASAVSQDARLASFTATLGSPYSVSDTDDDPVVDGIGDGFEINIVDSAGSSIKAIDFGASGTVPGDTDYHKQTFFNVNIDNPLIQVDICLEKVGNGVDGGGLVVGAMGVGAESGIEQFNVTVEGTAAQASSLSHLTSTYNTLEEVYVVSAAGSAADLTIGNGHTFAHDDGGSNCFGFEGTPNGAGEEGCDVVDQRNNALTDVLIFDSTGFANNLTLYANLSDDVRAKYLNVVDTAADAGADNDHAVYSFGSGDDFLSMSLSKNNMAFNGNTTREDFTFTTTTGDGDDTVLVQIGDGEAEASDVTFPATDGANWYTNHLLNDNLNIITGNGDDFVNTWGSTAARITTGDGNDVVYTDNSGVEDTFFNGTGMFNCNMATWVFNSRNVDVDNLESMSADTVHNVANLNLTVQFMDFSATVNVGNSNGSINGVSVSDLTINQAIKAAINNDPVLSDFLVATDGPGRTLIVRSLVDGEVVVTDLSVSLSSSGPLNPAQVAGLALGLNDANGAISASSLASLGFAPNGSALAEDGDTDWGDGDGRYESQFGYDLSGGFPWILDGRDSQNVNNNRVELGTGDDSLALSSNRDSIEHVVISGAFGTDHILNFSAGTQATTVAPTAEVQLLTFAVDSGVDADLDTLDETTGPMTLNVTVLGTVIPVTVPAGTEPTGVAVLVANAINGAALPGVASAVSGVMSGVGTVTINYTVPAGDAPQATAVVTSGLLYTETQVVTVTGIQEDAEDVTVTIDLFGPFTLPIPAGSTIAQIEQIIVTHIQTTPAFGAAGITASVDDGDGNLVADGVFTINFDETYGSDPAPTTFAVTTANPEDNTVIAVTESIRTPVSELTIGGGTTTPFSPGESGLVGFDIFDLTGIIGAGGPGFFANNANFGAGDDLDLDTIAGGSTEYATINALVDSNQNGVILIDTVDADSNPANELAEIQAMVTVADGASNAPPGTTDTSVIFAVDDTSRINTSDENGVYANVYKVVDGAAAGDAAVSYLGRVYLGGTEHGAKTDLGNFEALALVNFTPLTPTQIIDAYGSVI